MLYKRPRPRRLVVERHRWLRGADLSSVTRRTPGENRADPCPVAQALGPAVFRLRRTYVPVGGAPGGAEAPGVPISLPDGLLNRGVMPLPQLAIYRHDRRKRALITLAGEIDLETAPLVCAALARCLSDGIRVLDVDLTPVTFCDCSGLNAFLYAAQRTREAGGTLRLHNAPPSLAHILDLTGCGFLLLGLPLGHLPPSLGDVPDPVAPAPPDRSVPLVTVLTGDVR